MRMTPNLNEVSTVFSANGTSTHSIFCIEGVCFSMTIHITHHTPFSEAVDAPNAPVVDDGTAHWITQGLSCGQDFRQHMFTLSKKIVGPTCCAWLIEVGVCKCSVLDSLDSFSANLPFRSKKHFAPYTCEL